MNQNTSQHLKNSTQKLSNPTDLITLNQVKVNPKYSHVRMSHERIQNLEKNGHIKIYRTDRGFQYVSLSDLEVIVQREKVESETLVKINELNTSSKYKHLNLHWDKTKALIQNGELVSATTIQGYQAVTLASLNEYLEKLSNDKYVAKEKLSQELKLSKVLMKFALDNGVKHKVTGNVTLVNLKSLSVFINDFKDTWFSTEEIISKSKVTPHLFYKFTKTHRIKPLKLGTSHYYQYHTIKADLEHFYNEYQKNEEILKNSREDKKAQSLIKNCVNLQQSILKLNNRDIYLNDEKDYISFIRSFDVEFIKYKDILYVKIDALNKIISSSVKVHLLNDAMLNFCQKNNIFVFTQDGTNLAFIKSELFDNFRDTFYYSTEESIKKLNTTITSFKNSINKTYINNKYVLKIGTEKNYFFKETIIELVKKQQDYLSKWYLPKQAHKFINKKMLEHYSSIAKKIRTTEIFPLLRTVESQGKRLYNKEDVHNLLDELEKNKQFDSLDISSPAKVLEIAIDSIYNLQFESTASKTSDIWHYFIKKEALERNRSEIGTRSYLKQMIACTEILIKATSETQKEIFAFTSNEMNLYFMAPETIPKDYKRIFYKFITSLHKQLNELALTAGKKAFNINNVIKVQDFPTNKKEKSIYPFSQYLELYDYANNIDYHKQKAIDDVRKNINQKNCTRYDSMWLFMIVNLNNPWNHEEITLLPTIDLTRTKVKNLDWLENNNIDLVDANAIFMQFRLWDSKRLKTGIKQNFHISSELLIAFATATAICQLRNEQEQIQDNNRLIDFKTAYQKLRHSHKPYTEFFKNFNSNFKYENLKLARSIISYKNLILTEFLEPDDESLKHDRGHAEMESTNIYVHLPKEHFDFLCKQLFSRDFLGNVYYNLSNIFYGHTQDRVEQTERIVALKKRFETILRVEGISNILNELSSEDNMVQEIIYGLDIGNVESLYNKINCNALPAKEKDYQCLNYQKGCLYSSRSCSRCPLSIPNYLAIMRIVDNILLTANEINSVFNTDNVQKKIVLSNKLHQYLLDFGSCIVRFSSEDKEEIYKIISIEREAFLALLTSLPNYQQFISYHEKLEGENEQLSIEN